MLKELRSSTSTHSFTYTMSFNPHFVYALSFAVGIGAHVGMSAIIDTKPQLIEKALWGTTGNHVVSQYTQRSAPS